MRSAARRCELACVAHHDENPRPFIWMATASDILEKVKRARKKLDMTVYTALCQALSDKTTENLVRITLTGST